ncbi:MAG: polyhydroxyalkanoate synthesis regulator DNA-binding domain-containing protein [Oligoflexia bacterium]|nr:polyhydroxyalkanoate synthesis regulator DNA-binding domain-containing protein [Oligoflexia bacterium]
MSKDVRIIKRYQNRKLYDTYQSCYVTLEEISQIIREGHEIQVIDNKTKNDITYMTQIQLLFDQERKSVKSGDTELLKRVIRAEEGTLTGYIRKLEAEKGSGQPSQNEILPDSFNFHQGTEINPNATNTMIETSTTLN